MRDGTLLTLTLSGIVLYPFLALQGRTKAAWVLFAAVAAQVVVLASRRSEEGYDKMDFFPWNEARIVRKRTRESTVIDCGWSLDQSGNDNIFSMDDPVVRDYNNASQ